MPTASKVWVYDAFWRVDVQFPQRPSVCLQGFMEYCARSIKGWRTGLRGQSSARLVVSTSMIGEAEVAQGVQEAWRQQGGDSDLAMRVTQGWEIRISFAQCVPREASDRLFHRLGEVMPQGAGWVWPTSDYDYLLTHVDRQPSPLLLDRLRAAATF